jgi:hypothetical protein
LNDVYAWVEEMNRLLSTDDRIVFVKEQCVPPHLAAGIVRWVYEHRRPGGFLTAVLENDLARAVSLADDESWIGLRRLVEFFNYALPAPCWGSKEAVKRWEECPVGPTSMFMP